MLRQILNWRSVLALVAIAIVIGTIFYSNYLAKKIATDERSKVNVWVQSLKTRAAANDQSALDLTNIITSENKEIPVIGADENDHPLGIGETLNLDSNLLIKDSNYLQKLLLEFKAQHEPIIVEISAEPLLINKYYYGDSSLLKEVRYYPLIQLVIVALFIIITLITINIRNKSTQNQVWAGMAKETAHQLGTPLSSLMAWIDYLKGNGTDDMIVTEMN